MIFLLGKVGRLVHNLVVESVDIRKVMEPYTTQKLKVASFHSNGVFLMLLDLQALKNIVLKHFLCVAGPYGITHLLLLSKLEISANLPCMNP